MIYAITNGCLLFLQILETIVGRLFSQRVLWNIDPQRVSKFMLLTARDQYRKRMNEQGGFVRKKCSIFFSLTEVFRA